MTALRAAPTLRDAMEKLPVFAWAHNARPDIVHHAVKDLWLKVSATQVENYTEPLVLLEDVRAAFAALAHPPEGAQPEPYRITIAINALRGIGMESEANAVAELATVLQAEGAQTLPAADAIPVMTPVQLARAVAIHAVFAGAPDSATGADVDKAMDMLFGADVVAQVRASFRRPAALPTPPNAASALGDETERYGEAVQRPFVGE